MERYPHSLRGYRRLSSMILVHLLATISFQAFAASIVRRSPEETNVYDIIQGVQVIKDKAEVTRPSNLVRLDHFQPTSPVSGPLLHEPKQLTQHTNGQSLKYDDLLENAMIESWSRSLFKSSKQTIEGRLLLEAARFHGLMGKFPFWQSDAAERLSALESALASIPSGWQNIHNAFATVVPVDHLTESRALYEAISERLGNHRLPQWWKDGKIVTSFDPVTECDLIFSWGDALALHDKALDPARNGDAIDTLLSISRHYYWKRTRDESYIMSFHGIQPMKFDFFNSEGVELSEARVNQLLGDPTTRTQSIRTPMKESQEGIKWSTNTLILEWYLQGLNPHLMDSFGILIEESAETDPEFLSLQQMARGSGIPLTPNRRIKLRQRQLNYAVERIPESALDELPKDEVLRMKNWYENALQLTDEAEEEEVVAQTTRILKHYKEVVQNGQLPRLNPSTSSRAQLRLLYESLFTNLVDFQNKLHWSDVKLDMKWIKTSVEFLGLSGQFPPLTIDTVHLSNELESTFSRVNQGWPTLIEVLKRWKKADILNRGYRRYQNVLARLRDHHPTTYWWQQGTLETSLDPLFELEERLAWGDQLSLWIPDFDLSTLQDRPQRITKLLSITRSYASKVTETGELGEHSIYDIPPIKFTFTLKSSEEIANKRLETLLGSRQELMTSVKVDLQAQKFGKDWWSDRLALEWFTMRLNPQIIGRIGAELQKMEGSWTLHFDEIGKSVTLSHLLSSTSPDERLAIKAFYAEAETGTSISQQVNVKSLIRYWSDTISRRVKQGEAMQEPRLRFLENLDSKQGVLALTEAELHSSSMSSLPPDEQREMSIFFSDLEIMQPSDIYFPLYLIKFPTTELQRSVVSSFPERKSHSDGMESKRPQRIEFAPLVAQLEAPPSSIHQDTLKQEKLRLLKTLESGENSLDLTEPQIHAESMRPLHPDEQTPSIDSQGSAESSKHEAKFETEHREKLKPVIEELASRFSENHNPSSSSMNDEIPETKTPLSVSKTDQQSDKASMHPDAMIPLRPDEQESQQSTESARPQDTSAETEHKIKFDPVIKDLKNLFNENHNPSPSLVNENIQETHAPSSASEEEFVHPLPVQTKSEDTLDSEQNTLAHTEPPVHDDSISFAHHDEQSPSTELQKKIESAKDLDALDEAEENPKPVIEEPEKKISENQEPLPTSTISEPHIPVSPSHTHQEMDTPSTPVQIHPDSEIPSSAEVNIKPHAELPHIEMLYPDPSANGNPPTMLQRLKTLELKDSRTDMNPTSPIDSSAKSRSLSDQQQATRAWPITSAVRRWWSKIINWLKITFQKPIRAGHYARKGRVVPPS
ncbi:uncharacterized protein MELLADRAFT_110264 [Melampsora larici-populina 98AG31]|uniref:Uncharacterized protein n=1 Tax=Melampsora larici-populina (strain 98AG31 / pathotype 3-4-7) TaxID=747676 RepID=F4RZ73_MELLP|nr:uncharacterized protein MELLADRAFT_110264 [Melampsora larici-populina 98AG31]EGG02358.1 hypothetical protein MELLADRAFT_110264 [Melampsora larici-populina 98AG31]